MTAVDSKKLFQESVYAEEEEEARALLQSTISPGDHLYRYSSFAGIPGLVQNHAIVSKINTDGTIVIVDCDALIRGNQEDACKILESDLKDGRSTWKLVHYEASWWRRHLNRSGTCTATASDSPGLVLARLHFLLTRTQQQQQQQQNDTDSSSTSILPSHHFLKANSECVAVTRLC
jgi:hypothetical protein